MRRFTTITIAAQKAKRAMANAPVASSGDPPDGATRRDPQMIRAAHLAVKPRGRWEVMGHMGSRGKVLVTRIRKPAKQPKNREISTD
jgi:hypothetical protein